MAKPARKALGGGGGSAPVKPAGLGIDAGEAYPAAAAPWTSDRARRGAEVGDQLAASAAGHTLPRPVSRLALIDLVVVLLARHEAVRLASHT
jgi:hypothetical protein